MLEPRQPEKTPSLCGIVGQARADGCAPRRQVLEQMCDALAHRGPDSRGIHGEGPAGLGIQRLRIIDLDTGDQPISNEDRSATVVLNGEIYNYRELRRELEGRGHRFASRSDTEVIVHLYEERGIDCVHALHGMFAFALWDAKRERMFLARDRVGKKPLFYALSGGALRFASELNALMRDHEIPREIDHAALDAYLAYQYIPAPLSAFEAVRKLPPASRLVYEGGRATIDHYWRLDYSRKLDTDEPEEICELIRDQVDRAVRRRMVSDVPLGAFLSGGIDSSCVVASMAEVSAEPVRTFSIGFRSEDESFNELPRARTIADRYATEHREFVVEPDSLEMLPRVVRQYGEPMADSSAIPSFYLASLAAQFVTVALNGDGGDESFAGYPRYVSNALAQRLERVPAPLRRLVSAGGSRLPRSGEVSSTANRIRRAALSASLSPPDRYRAYVTHLNGLDRDRLYTSEFRELTGPGVVPGVIGAPWAESSAANVVDRMLDVDIRTYLPGDLLVKMDIASMAYSLEARSPLLDHELMEFAASLPPEWKLRGREKKVGLRRAMRGRLPDEILDGPKQGFQVPLAEWLRGELRPLAHEVLLDSTARERSYFNPGYVRELLDQHATRQADHSRGLWALLVFELWHRDAVDRRDAQAPLSPAAA